MNFKKFFKKHRLLLLILGTGFLLVLLHIPFYLAHRIEDDSYISFTCGKTLAESGTLGFNKGEKISVCTSHLYVLIIAASHLVFGDFFIQAVMLFNLIISLWALYIMSSLFYAGLKQRLILWSISSFLPQALLIVDKGMETPILIFLIAVILKWVCSQKFGLSACFALFLVPFVRPDWAVFILLPIIYVFIKNRKIDYKILLSAISGTLAFFIFNKLYFGHFLNQSIIAKSHLIVKTPFWELLGKVFFSNDFGIFLPINISSLYIRHFILIFLFYSSGILFFTGFVYFVFKFFKSSNQSHKNILAVMLGLIFFVPVLYAFGGVIFSWYLLPSALLAYFLLASGLITFLNGLGKRNKIIMTLIILILFLILIGCQLLIDVYAGSLNYYYYSEVGKYIKSISSENDSIMLEPLGVIPFFAKRYAHDEAGLASPLVTEYWEKYGLKWWINYVKDKKPTFLVERSVDAFGLSLQEKEWFDGNYSLVKEFHYNLKDYPSVNFIDQFVSKIFRMGFNSVFYIYKKI